METVKSFDNFTISIYFNKINYLGKEAKFIPDFDECVSYIKNNIEQNDIVMTLGAGTVTKIGPMLIS